MDRETIPQQKRSLGADFWWPMILGLILLIFNVIFYFQAYFAHVLGQSVLDGKSYFSVGFSFLLFYFLGFSLISLLRKQGVWIVRAPLRLSVTTGQISIFPVIFVSLVIGLIGGGLDYLADALTLAPLIGCSEVLAGVGGAQLGRLIGNLFLHRQSTSD
jgi:hypothetical protein